MQLSLVNREVSIKGMDKWIVELFFLILMSYLVEVCKFLKSYLLNILWSMVIQKKTICKK